MYKRTDAFVSREVSVWLSLFRTPAVPLGFKKFIVRVSGVRGGHPLAAPGLKSGNAIDILISALAVLFIKTDILLVSISADGVFDRIPNSAEAVFFGEASPSVEVLRLLQNVQTELAKKYGEPSLRIQIEPMEEKEEERRCAFPEKSEAWLIGFLMQIRSGFVPGLSKKAFTNLFSVAAKEEEIVIRVSCFGKNESELKKVCRTLDFCSERANVFFV